jgi:hypothetical protein
MSIATALEIQHATGESLINPIVLNSAKEMAMELCEGDYEKLDRISTLMYKYSATLASVVATNVSYACLGEDTMDIIADEIREFEALAQQVESENN